MLWGVNGDNMMLSAANRSGWLVVGVLTSLVMALAGGHFYRSAWKSLRNRTATMDTLVALGTAAAWLYSMVVNLWPDMFPMAARHLYYEASAMIIGLINLGHMLEALEKLLDLTPPTARVVTDHGEQTLALSAVTLGVNTGDRVPVDGTIIQGEAWLDEAMLTGEAVPQRKLAGDTLHAGTVMQDGSVLLRADALQRASTLSMLVFEKTGTLTEGKPRVVEIQLFDGADEPSVLRQAAALEQGSGHPLAQAIVARAGLSSLPEIAQFRTIPGQGVSGILDGIPLLLGNPALMAQQQIATDTV